MSGQYCDPDTCDAHESYVFNYIKNSTQLTKRSKIQHKTPVMMGSLFTRNGTDEQRVIKILLDSGTSSTIISGRYCQKLRKMTETTTTWNTQGGKFTTNYIAKIKFVLPELDAKKVVMWKCHVDNGDTGNRYVI